MMDGDAAVADLEVMNPFQAALLRYLAKEKLKQGSASAVPRRAVRTRPLRRDGLDETKPGNGID